MTTTIPNFDDDSAPLVGETSASEGLVPMLLGRIVALGVQFLTLALIGRALGPEDFGVLQLALVVFVYLTFAGDLGLSVLGTRDFAGPAHLGSSVGQFVGARVALTVVVVVFTVGVTVASNLSEQVVLVVALLSCGLVASAFSLRWLLQARRQFLRIALTDIVASVVQLAAAIGLVRAGAGIVWAAATMSLAPVTSSLMTAGLAGLRNLDRRWIPRVDKSSLGLVRRAVPAGLAVFATSVYFNIDSILLGVMKGATEVGYYAAAYRIVFACLVLPVVANSVALPALTRLTVDAQRSLPEALRALSSTLVLLALPVAVGTTMLSSTLVTFIFGPAFADSATPLAILIWTCVTVSANTPFAALMLARRQDRAYFTITSGGVVFNVAANFLAIPVAGMIGAAAVTIGTELLVLLLIVRQTADVAPRILRDSLRSAILPTVVMALFVWPLRTELVAIPVGIAAFSIATLVTGAAQIRDLRRFFSV